MNVTKPHPDRANANQVRYLKERLAAAEREKRSVIREQCSNEKRMPAAIKKAKARVEEWERKTYDAANERRNKLERELNAQVARVRETVLFSKPAEALAAVQAFERTA